MQGIYLEISKHMKTIAEKVIERLPVTFAKKTWKEIKNGDILIAGSEENPSEISCVINKTQSTVHILITTVEGNTIDQVLKLEGMDNNAPVMMISDMSKPDVVNCLLIYESYLMGLITENELMGQLESYEVR